MLCSIVSLMLCLAAPGHPLQEGEGPSEQHRGRRPLPSSEEIAELPPDGGPEFNRLVFARSPYLRQHARNPVDWREWGAEAFAEAKRRDVPVFLSIGYSTCHWCHVMEYESFEDEAVAKLMNEAFVCVKVDREERPDIDELYMRATRAFTGGSGGWPMTVVLDPEQRPFFAWTYVAKETVGGRVGMLDLVPALSEGWAERREEATTIGEQMTEFLRTWSSSGAERPEWSRAELLATARRTLAAAFDPVNGGFGTAPKFPVASDVRLLLRLGSRGDEQALGMATRTLRAWRQGGVFDQVGHGMHRYSTTADWSLPHFEKMLYDQALTTMAWTDAWLLTGDEDLRRAAEDVIGYVLRDLQAPEGGFYSAEDADSGGEEGLFYTWTLDEIRNAKWDDRSVTSPFGEDEVALLTSVFGLTEEGNFLDEATGERTGRNVLHRVREVEGDEQTRVRLLLAMLQVFRDERERPFLDDKILTDWNGLMISALARAGRAFSRPDCIAAARRAASYVERVHTLEDGSLHKRSLNGEAGLPGMLDDYAAMAHAWLDLFEVGHDPADLVRARRTVDRALALFEDEERGGFFTAPAGAEALIARTKSVNDGARPSGNSLMAAALTRLARLTGEPAYEAAARRAVDAFAVEVVGAPSSHTAMLAAVDHLEAGEDAREIVIVGADEAARAMVARLALRYAPNDVVIHLDPTSGRSSKLIAAIPFLERMAAAGPETRAYVCSGKTCSAPVTTLDELLELLAR